MQKFSQHRQIIIETPWNGTPELCMKMIGRLSHLAVLSAEGAQYNNQGQARSGA
jgi:hypothetical protein